MHAALAAAGPGAAFRCSEARAATVRRIGVVVDTSTTESGEAAAALRDAPWPQRDPVVFLEPKRLYNGPFDGLPDQPAVPWTTHPAGEVPEGHYTLPIGQCAVAREGRELTVVTSPSAPLAILSFATCQRRRKRCV